MSMLNIDHNDNAEQTFVSAYEDLLSKNSELQQLWRDGFRAGFEAIKAGRRARIPRQYNGFMPADRMPKADAYCNGVTCGTRAAKFGINVQF